MREDSAETPGIRILASGARAGLRFRRRLIVLRWEAAAARARATTPMVTIRPVAAQPAAGSLSSVPML